MWDRYRRLRTYFSMTDHWRDFDTFFTSKAETYKSSSGAIIRTFSLKSLKFSSLRVDKGRPGQSDQRDDRSA